MSITSTAGFYEDPQVLLHRDVAPQPAPALPPDSLDHFEIDDTFEWIKTNNFKRVALQFPDTMLQHASGVYGALSRKCSSLTPIPAVTILADTAYGQCCVDEVAAEHFNADCLVHYGPACLSANQRLPVKYVFGKSELNVDALVGCLKTEFPSESDRVAIFYDVAFHHKATELEKRVKIELNCKVSVAKLKRLSASVGGDLTADQSSSQSLQTADANSIEFCGRHFRSNASNNVHLDGWNVVYIGPENRTLTNIVMTFNQATVYRFDAESSSLHRQTLSSNKALMRRFYLIERAKDADIIGILVGTLAVSKYLDMLQHLQNIIKKANKTFYTFVVGKLNVPKLANFQEVDLFVIVACPENSILDSKDFFKPVVTPFELEIALVPGKSWNNRYSTEFKTLLEETSTADYFAKDEQNDETDTDTRVSLVSRSIKSNHKVTQQEDSSLPDTETAPDGTVVIRNQNTQLMRREAPTAMDFFLQRSYKGLEQQLGETPVVTASVGRPGIPMEYEGEPSAFAATAANDEEEADLDDQIQSENA